MCNTVRWVVMVVILIPGLTASRARSECPAQWVTNIGVPGFNGNGVGELVEFDDGFGAGSSLYASGFFTSAGGTSANNIAKWNGSTWSPLGAGMNSAVYTLAVFNDGSGSALFAGGGFTTAGGGSANCIAKWNGSTWSALGSGMPQTGGIFVATLAVFDDGGGPDLYAGGSFTTAGGLPASRVARWNGSAWSALGSGVNDQIEALVVFNDGSGPALFAGGNFTTAGGGAANYVAKWNGTTWSPLGSGMGGAEGIVHTLTVFDDGSGPALVAAGRFTTAGGTPANRIAKWNGTNWSALGSGINADVYSLAAFDDGTGSALYAGGDFTTAGGNSASNIAKWNGSTWSALGTGVDIFIVALLSVGQGDTSALYVGGGFTTAGGLTANGIAKWGNPCAVHYVDAGASGANNGSSWPNAFRNLQNALLVAQAGDQIWVSDGTYMPDGGYIPTGGVRVPGSGLRTATFQLLDGVALYGGFAGIETQLAQRNPAANVTILSGDLLGNDGPNFTNNGDNSFHVANGTETDATSVLDGFTIRGGNAQGSVLGVGAGMFIGQGSPTLRRCTFTSNNAVGGGAMYIWDSSHPFISDCVFAGNQGFDIGSGGAGAIYVATNSNPTFVRCDFIANSSTGGPSPNGGALHIANNCNPFFHNCRFLGNTAQNGGAIVIDDSAPTFFNCLFSGNQADDGAAIRAGTANFAAYNCTFSGNTATVNGGGIHTGGSSPTLSNCVLWGNSDPGGMDESAQIYTSSGTPTVNYSIVQGGWSGAGGTGNSASDPLFVDAVGPDYDLRVLSGSPAIDAGSNTAVPADTLDLDNDGNTAEAIPFDFDGRARFIQDRLSADTGAGAPPLVDMGAFEFARDCNSNGVADDNDLTLLAATDCNSNDIPDSCDINPNGPVAMQDCNNNSLPDVCDVPPLGSSVDANMDGVPDECANAVASGNWDQPATWDLGGGQYPDNNTSAPNVAVTVDNFTVTLNIPVTVPTIQVVNDATILATMSGGLSNLSIVGASGLSLRGEPSSPATPTGLIVDNDPMIIVSPGEMTLNDGASYQALGVVVNSCGVLGNAGSANALAILQTRRLVLSTNGTCGSMVILTGTMQVEVTEDLVINGATAGGGAALGHRFASGVGIPHHGEFVSDEGSETSLIADASTTLAATATSRARLGKSGESPQHLLGGCVDPPPTLMAVGSSIIEIFGNLIINGDACVVIGGTGSNANTLSSSGTGAEVLLHGDFINYAASAENFHMEEGRLILVGLGPHMVEMGGAYRGGSLSGFTDNFAIGELVVDPGATVFFVDAVDNLGSGSVDAMYVDTLSLGAGATVYVDSGALYYNQLPAHTGSIIPLNGGEVSLTVNPPALAPFPHNRTKNRYISFAPNNGAEMVAFRVDKTSSPVGSCWVQAPVQSGANQYTATCAAAPVFRVWTEPAVHVGDCEIIPVASYEIRASRDAIAFTNPHPVNTIALPSANNKLWGDVCGINNGTEWSPPNQFTNVNDVLALLAFISGAAIRPQFTVANLQAISSADSCLNAFVNTADVQVSVRAIAGDSYGPPATGKIINPALCPVCP